MKMYASGMTSMTSSTMTASVSARLTQISLGRSVGRSARSMVSAIMVSRSSASSTFCSASAAWAAGIRCPGRTVTRPVVDRVAAAPGLTSVPRTMRLPPKRRRQNAGWPIGVESASALAGAYSSEPMRLRSASPSIHAKTRAITSPVASDGSMGTKISVGDTPSADAARTVGPPHGTMLSVPFMRPATHVSTTGLMPRRR